MKTKHTTVTAAAIDTIDTYVRICAFCCHPLTPGASHGICLDCLKKTLEPVGNVINRIYTDHMVTLTEG